MKKPEKKLESLCDCTAMSLCGCLVEDYNQGYDDWEAYHAWVLEQLPNEDELGKIIRDCDDKWEGEPCPIPHLAEAIYARIGVRKAPNPMKEARECGQRHNGIEPDPEGAFVFWDDYETLKARLMGVLRKYGQHSKECIAEKYPEAWHCICGFTQALKEAK